MESGGGRRPSAGRRRRPPPQALRRSARARRDTAGGRPVVRGESLIARYLELLTRCRDCREALLALQSIPIEPPAAPEGLAVRREGNRRVLSWRAADVGQAAHLVRRAALDYPTGLAAGRPPFQTIYEGDALSFSDDEVAHGGVILRYMIHAVARGRIEVEGTTIRTYETISPSAAFDGVLIWQEVMNLRSARRDRALELTWFVPTGARPGLDREMAGRAQRPRAGCCDPAGDCRRAPPRRRPRREDDSHIPDLLSL